MSQEDAVRYDCESTTTRASSSVPVVFNVKRVEMPASSSPRCFQPGDVLKLTLKEEYSTGSRENCKAWSGGKHLGVYAESETGTTFFAKIYTNEESAAYGWAYESAEASKHVSPLVITGKFKEGSPFRKVLLVQDVGTTYLDANHVKDPDCTARVVKAVWALNQVGVLILDLKPQHIIVPPDPTLPVKIVDFHLAATVRDWDSHSQITGSPLAIDYRCSLYSPPFFQGNTRWASVFQHMGLLCDPACDLQSLCFIFHWLLFPDDLRSPRQDSEETSSRVKRYLALMHKLQLLQQYSSSSSEQVQSFRWLEKAKLLCEARVSGCRIADLFDIMMRPPQEDSLPVTTEITIPTAPPLQEGKNEYICCGSCEEPGTYTFCGVNLAAKDSYFLGTFDTEKEEQFLSLSRSQHPMDMSLPSNTGSQSLLCPTRLPTLEAPSRAADANTKNIIYERAYIPEILYLENKEILREKFLRFQKHMLEEMNLDDNATLPLVSPSARRNSWPKNGTAVWR